MFSETFEHHVFFTTVRITVPSHDGLTSSCGTGFIFNVPLAQDGLMGTFLVSNRHVFGDPGGTLILNLHKCSPEGGKAELGQVVPVVLAGFGPFFYGHPNSDVDLACINISGFVGPEKGVFYKSLTPEFVDDNVLSVIYAGQSVSFVGYPDSRFDTAHNLPILRKGYLATIPSVDFNGLPQILIDAQVFPGSSGSPVFATVGNMHRLIGVIAQTMIRHAALQAIPVGTNMAVQQMIGLGIVLKVSLVKELLISAASGLSERIGRPVA